MPESQTLGRAVILTGAAGVLGQAMARALVEAGHRILLCDLAEQPLRDLAAKIGSGAERLATCAADLTDPAGPETLVETATKAFGRVDMLINNAAVTAFATWPVDRLRPAPWKMDTSLVRRFFETNMIAQHTLSSLVLPGMIERGWGRIINVTCSYDTMQRIFPYGATKAAMEAYTAALHRDLANTGVSANTLNPGGPVAFPEHVEKNPGRKWVTADVMNGPILWLASEASNGTEGRRYVGSRWDLTLLPEAAAARASGPMSWVGFGDAALR